MRALESDPVYAALAAHAVAYAAYDAQFKRDAENDDLIEPLCEAEREAADTLAETVLTMPRGAATALAYVRALNHAGYPLLDDYGCYLLIASVETALRRALADA
jgi:hypothetical protein